MLAVTYTSPSGSRTRGKPCQRKDLPSFLGRKIAACETNDTIHSANFPTGGAEGS